MQAIELIGRVVADLGRAETFYREGLGFTRMGLGRSLVHGMACESVRMRLGEEVIELARLDVPGRPYPPGSCSSDLWFQHLAIVVADMGAAYAMLSARTALVPMSWGGPQTLPPRNGGVQAFKFRDPDGHPLELIWFPPGQGRPRWQHRPGPTPFLGLDHSALAVSDTPRSRRFYRRLGFRVAYRSRNYGPAQARLDGLHGARARITGLRVPGADGPGLELLGYRPPGRAGDVADNDIAADWVVLGVPALPEPRLLRDPDGHRMVLIGSMPD